MKIHYSLYSCTIYQLLVLRNAEAIIGENVWPAMPNEFPFIASIGVKNPNTLVERGHMCGGSLITKKHVLTAAHCLENYAINRIDVIIGEQDLKSAVFRYEVHSWITYDDWAEHLKIPIEFPLNDIAIIQLNTTVRRPGVRPVTLSSLNDERLHRINAVIAGWGVSNQGNLMDVLQRAKVTILTPEQCTKRMKLVLNVYIFMDRNYLCCSANPYILSSCGDSGGPLLNERNVLLGVLRGRCPSEKSQWGNFSLAFINKYRVNRYASVDYYRFFIENVTGLQTRPMPVLSFEVPSDS